MVLIGRVVRDASITTLKDKRQVVNFSLAVNDRYKPKGSDTWVKCSSFFNCSYWINPKLSERLTKGVIVEVSGRLSVNAYNTMEGEAKASLNFHVDSVKIHQHMNAVTALPKVAETTEDLPF